jgi:hypothetical protein
MKRLHALVRREGGPAAEVRTFTGERLYGLQFYLGGTLRRVGPYGDEPWADERLGDTVEELRRPLERTQVLVASAAAAPELEGALDAAGVPYRRAQAGARFVFVVSPPASARANALEAAR